MDETPNTNEKKTKNSSEEKPSPGPTLCGSPLPLLWAEACPSRIGFWLLMDL